MHVKCFQDPMQYGHQASVKVGPQVVKIQIQRPVDKVFPKYLSFEFDQPCHIVSTSRGVSAREMVFQSDPIWLPGMRKSWSTSGKNSDFETCRQRFSQVFIT